tara:strand:+ start:223 stop:456 length:234 start_codon:yes stop_codon:yes gene_type:complete
MASLEKYSARKNWRVRYTVYFGHQKRRRAQHCTTKAAATAMRTRLAELERATKDQVGSNAQIKKWIQDGFLTSDEAA